MGCIYKTELSTFLKVCSFVPSKFRPFEQITASMFHGIEVISLWLCTGVMEAQVALIAALSVSVLLGLWLSSSS